MTSALKTLVYMVLYGVITVVNVYYVRRLHQPLLTFSERDAIAGGIQNSYQIQSMQTSSFPATVGSTNYLYPSTGKVFSTFQLSTVIFDYL